MDYAVPALRYLRKLAGSTRGGVFPPCWYEARLQRVWVGAEPSQTYGHRAVDLQDSNTRGEEPQGDWRGCPDTESQPVAPEPAVSSTY
jgi:hypothetical protein